MTVEDQSLLHKVAANKIARTLLTFLAAITLPFLALFLFIASRWLDRFFGLPDILPYSWKSNVFTLLVVMGASITLWSIAKFVNVNGLPVSLIFPPATLVTTGLYAYTRNPMLLGVIIALIGFGAGLNSFSVVFIFTPLFILLNVIELKKLEEPELEKRFGSQYLEYKRRTPMFIPGLKKPK